MNKSIFLFKILFVSCLCLVNCSKETEVADNTQADTPSIKEGIPFELFAKPVETKTVNDGLNTNWKAGDAINVFHAVSGSTSYTSDGSFSIASEDVASGRFTGTISSKPASGTYDWYMFYPYNEDLTTPANTSTKSFYIGGRTDEAQQQTGNSSKAHLAGTNYPLYGKAAGMSFDSVPSLSMEHVCAYIEFNVTNNSGMPLTVEDITFTATEDIVGQFYINFTNPSAVAFAEGTYTTDVATLEVTSGTPIADKASAAFYVGIKPFTAPKDGTLAISVNGYKKSINLSSKSVEFSAGKIKRLNFDYDFKPALYSLASSVAAGDEVIVASGTSGTVNVMSHYDNSYNNHRSTTASVAGANITSSPSMATLTLASSGTAYTLYDAKTALYLNATNTTSYNYLKATEEVDNYAKFSISFSGSAAVITCTGKSSRNILRANGTIFACYTSGQSPVYLYKKTKTPVSLAVTTPPAKTNYTVGETLDLTGAVFTATYDDASTADVTASVTTDAETVLAHAGTGKSVTVSFGGQTTSFTVNVAKGEAELDFATKSYSVAPSASFETPELTNPHSLTVNYSSSDTGLVTVNAITGAITIGSSTGGPVTITASTTGNDDYNAGNAAYTITIVDAVPEYIKLFDISSASVVTNSSYAAGYTYTDAGSRSWLVTFGGNNVSMGSNKNNRSNCTLGTTYSKYAVSPVTTSSIASAFVNTTSISDVSKIHYEVGGGSNQTNTTVYLIYSSDGTTFSQMALTSGTQGHDIVTAGYDFIFEKCSGYFGLLLKQKENNDANWRLDNVKLTFYKYE